MNLRTKKKKQQAVLSRGFDSQSLTTELAHAEALIRREQSTEADSLLIKLKSSHPENLDVLANLLANIAEICLKQALEIDLNNPILLNNLALAYTH